MPVRQHRFPIPSFQPSGTIRTLIPSFLSRLDPVFLFAFAGIIVLILLIVLTLGGSLGSGSLKGGFSLSGVRLELPVDQDVSGRLLAFISTMERDGSEAEPSALPPAPKIPASIELSQYTVRSGDSTASIAKKFGISMSTLISLNRLENARNLAAGKKLRIPNMDGLSYTVRSGDNLSKIAKTYGITVNAILDANNMASAVLNPGMELFIPGAAMRSIDVKRALGELFKMPVPGRLTSGFGMRDDPFTGVRRFHYGIDLAADTGTPVKAAMEGTVAVVGTHTTYGKYIILKHDDGYQTWYAHLDSMFVKTGQHVSEGQLIGEVGSTGYSTGPHLHFSIYRRGTGLDPLKYLYQ